ncbi:MAG: AmmeMemoRadiSam system protein B, partial [Elusimicrobiales bacterium]|nr:AmmeMemoRadiSam system protein B [Elusimicrobiales bacterium]
MSSKNSNHQSCGRIRLSAAAGQFYPADADELKKKIKDYLESANSGIELTLNPKAIIAPHAGYDYSGLVAATAFNAIKGKEIDTVVIISNSHTDYFSGAVIDKSDAWETPLGSVLIDHDMAERLIGSSDLIKYNSEVHTSDHTLEVQLPFLQIVLQ